MSTENEKRKAVQHSIDVAELRLEQLQKRKAAKTMSRSEMFELEMTVAVIKRGKSLLNEKVADPLVNPVGEACQGASLVLHAQAEEEEGEDVSYCNFPGCGGCACHNNPPCDHCIEHVCEHKDGLEMCDECEAEKTTKAKAKP